MHARQEEQAVAGGARKQESQGVARPRVVSLVREHGVELVAPQRLQRAGGNEDARAQQPGAERVWRVIGEYVGAWRADPRGADDVEAGDEAAGVANLPQR